MKKKILRIIFLFLAILFVVEILLKILGFGNPVVYHNKENYFPKSNQDVIRFKGAKVKINEFGMRTNYNWKNTNDKYKILFFGDSVTFGGSYIDNKDLFSEKLCELIKKSICGNYGVNGYKIHNINVRVQDIIKKIDFDHLIIVVSDSIEDGRSNFIDFPFYENFNYKLFKSTFEIVNHILFKYKLKNNYHKYEDKNINQKITNLSDLAKTLSNSSINVDIFILPTIQNLNQNYNKKHLIENINSKNLKVHNIYEDIKILNYDNYYFNNAHLNKKGHDYFSKMIYDKIR